MRKELTKFAALWAMAIALGFFSVSSARADDPGKHPFYLHALSDLRGARWLIEHRPGDAAVSEEETKALKHIDEAIHEIKKAAIDDGKDLKDHPEIDVPDDHAGHLHKAIEILKKIHSDVDREEDDAATEGLKHRATEHIDKALHETEKALKDIEEHK